MSVCGSTDLGRILSSFVPILVLYLGGGGEGWQSHPNRAIFFESLFGGYGASAKTFFFVFSSSSSSSPATGLLEIDHGRRGEGGSEALGSLVSVPNSLTRYHRPRQA